MIYYKSNQWNICTEKAKYIQDGIELENYVGQEGKEWWTEFKGIEIIEFIEIDVTGEQLVRLEEVNQLDIGDGHSAVLSDYVIKNTFPSEANHILKDLQSKKNRELNIEYFIDLDFRISMQEMGL